MRIIQLSTKLLLLILVFYASSFSILASPVSDHGASGNAVTNFHKGVEIFRRAVLASGGKEALQGFQAVDLVLEGGVSNATQYASPAAMNEVHPEPVLISILLDFAGDNYSQEVIQQVRGGLGVHSRLSFSKGTLSIIWPKDETYSQFPAKPDAIIALGASVLPAFLLKEAMHNVASISWERDSEIEGEKTMVVGFSWKNQRRYFLHISDETYRVRALEYVLTDALVGDDNVLVIYEGEQNVGGIVFPERIRQIRRHSPYADLVLRIAAINDDVDATAVAVIDHYDKISPPIPSWNKVAEHVFEVQNLFIGNYRSIVIELKDSIVVFDAPINSQVTGQVRKLIAENLGDKPISHLILSHYHLDHAGGLGVYAAEGATIVTGPGNEEYFTQIALARSHSVGIFANPVTSAVPDFAVVGEGETLTISDGDRVVEVTNIGPIPHVDAMLVAYVEGSAVAINGDLYATATQSNANYEAYEQWLRLNHADASVIIGVHHAAVTGQSYFDR